MPYEMNAWTDGVCRGNGRPGAVGGAAAWFNRPVRGSKSWWRKLPEYPIPTNQRAELTGVIMALELATERRAQLYNDPYFILTIHTDSEYVKGCFCTWIHKWKNNGWLNARGVEVVNRDLIEEASDMIDQIEENGTVDFVKIPRDDNEEADELANGACDD
ncbi:Ribonuclease H1 [Mycena sanguinolenta]|uniref:ribonuclease H n=1 Tax=Mycena sanguinolenta TaxID=230812 RepID=A0A8H7CV57_9AGAR|nr:Ribonuclease H1 [Mycena sanguinolenta]